MVTDDTSQKGDPFFLRLRQKLDYDRVEEIIRLIRELADKLDYLSIRDRTEPIRLLLLVAEQARHAPQKQSSSVIPLTQEEREALQRIARDCD